MERTVDFSPACVIACGTLKPELDALQEQGFLNAKKLMYTGPGLHEWQSRLEQQLTERLRKAKKVSDKALVLYGERCYMDPKDPTRGTDILIMESFPRAFRINAANCVDMLAGEERRQEIAGADKVYWLTPGWVQHWDFIFKNWDAGKANEMFPQHDKAVVLDALGSFDRLMAENPEKVLRISDWMKIPLEAVPVTLDRLKALLTDGMRSLQD